jgi:general L-amino acid transport system substrate-binding protein
MSSAALILAVWCLTGCGRPAKAPPPPAADVGSGAAAAKPALATLERIKARRRLKCGVADDLPGFSERGLTGQWRGFDVDICRAVAAAVLGDARAVNFTGLSSRTRYAALASGDVDLVASGASWTFTHDVALGLAFAGVSYHDSQGFLAPAPKPAAKPRRGQPVPPPASRTLASLNGARICVQGGSAQQQALAETFRARALSYRPIVKEDRLQALQAYQRRECDALTDDISVLAIDRAALGDSERHAVMTETIADEPLGPVVREGDERWADIVRWTLNALILAEEAKLNSRLVEGAKSDSVDASVRRLLGAEGDTGQRLGLSADWAYRAIRQVGSYDEIFDRNLGPETPLKLERGRNALWDAEKPGQLWAPPLR